MVTVQGDGVLGWPADTTRITVSTDDASVLAATNTPATALPAATNNLLAATDADQDFLAFIASVRFACAPSGTCMLRLPLLSLVLWGQYHTIQEPLDVLDPNAG